MNRRRWRWRGSRCTTKPPTARRSVWPTARGAPAASLRERLSADFWSLLLELERGLTDVQHKTLTETDALARVEGALRTLAGLSGLAQENMNRTAGWRFLDIGRRIERGVNICRFARMFGHPHANSDELDLLLDLADSQITYRARYLVGIARAPVLDMVSSIRSTPALWRSRSGR